MTMSRTVGAGMGKGGDRGSIIPRFATSSVTTPDFRWLAAEAWTDERKLEFARFRQALPQSNAYAPVPWESNRRRVPPVLVGRWLLERDEGAAAVGAAEVVGILRAFRTLHVTVTRCGDERSGGWVRAENQAALSLLLSAVMMAARADLVVLALADEAAAAALGEAGWGVVKEVWVPQRTLFVDAFEEAPAARRMQTVTVDPHEWWLTDRGAADRKTLSYLEKRLDLEEREAEASARPPRQGMLMRMSRLLRWR
jgi:hypothetical protein